MPRKRGRDHHETDLGLAAVVSDRGRRHHRNEDAYALAARGDRVAAVVCDGVSSTPNPDEAATAAAAAAMSVLEAHLDDTSWPESDDLGALFTAALDAARNAVAAVPATEVASQPGSPSTTLVAALAAPGRAGVANIGDSRAYWLAADGSEDHRLTVDDSYAEDAIAAGMPAAEAYTAPGAHIITRWLGTEGDDQPPTISSLDIESPGLLVVCSDGLWNYFESPAALGKLARDAPAHAGPIGVARHLVDAAINAGGDDNVTVAVIPTGPA